MLSCYWNFCGKGGSTHIIHTIYSKWVIRTALRVVTQLCNIRIISYRFMQFWIQARPERELITLCKMRNLEVSTLQLSSLLGRSRFRSGRFGGGRAAGELVLDCQSCPVYHLDGLIVLQSQLSSLENCVDLHSKKPAMQLYLWFTETELQVIMTCLSHYCCLYHTHTHI